MFSHWQCSTKTQEWNECAFSETKDLVNDDELFDSFAKPFATHFNENKGITRGDVRKLLMLKFFGKENQFQVSRPSKKFNCGSCTRERIEIHKAMKNDEENNTNFLIKIP